jgi:hypothetical protein
MNLKNNPERTLLIYLLIGLALLSIPTFGVAALAIWAYMFFWAKGDLQTITKAHVKYHFQTVIIGFASFAVYMLYFFAYAYFFGSDPLSYEGYLILIPMFLAFVWPFFRIIRSINLIVKWQSPLKPKLV